MKDKRGQQELIVTVLLVLIALVAVVIISTFIVRYVREGTSAAASKAQCGKIMLTVTKASGTTVVLRRDDSNSIPGTTNITVWYANGTHIGSNSQALPGALATASITVPALHAGQAIEITPVLSDGTICTAISTATTTA